MSKNILILEGSPRVGGNSDILTDEFIKGAKESGHNCEKIYLHKLHMEFCLGCLACQETHKCVIDDDVSEVLDKMVNADVIVMASPVYYYSMSGQMKTFIDRSNPRCKEAVGKDFYFIFSAFTPHKSHLDTIKLDFESYLKCLNEPTIKGMVDGTNATLVGEIKNNEEAMTQAYELGKGV